MERSRARRIEEESRRPVEEEESKSVAVRIENLSIKTVGAEEGAAESLKEALGMEIEEYS